VWYLVGATSRGHHRVTVPFEFGVIFSSAPVATLSFTGTICQTNGTNCRDAGADSTFQTRVHTEETKLNDTIKPFRFTRCCRSACRFGSRVYSGRSIRIVKSTSCVRLPMSVIFTQLRAHCQRCA